MNGRGCPSLRVTLDSAHLDRIWNARLPMNSRSYTGLISNDINDDCSDNRLHPRRITAVIIIDDAGSNAAGRSIGPLGQSAIPSVIGGVQQGRVTHN